MRFPVAIAMSGVFSYALNRVLLKTLLTNDLKEENLLKYHVLDLNAQMMKEDLGEMGIKIKAANYDEEAT